MIIKKITCEINNEESRMLLKRIETSEGVFYNRIIPSNNSICNYEKNREKFDKDPYQSFFQTCHINWNNDKKEWNFNTLEKSIKHSNKYKRALFPYFQRNQSQLTKLTWEIAENEFLKMLSMNVQFVPIHIPLKTTKDEWLEKKVKLLSLLNENQRLVPIISIKHEIRSFENIIEFEMLNSQFIGITVYSLADSRESIKLSIVRMLNAKFKEGENCPLIIYFNQPRFLSNYSRVNSSFVYSCYAGDVFSQQIHFIDKINPELFEKNINTEFVFDYNEGVFNTSTEQEKLGYNITQDYLERVPVGQGLTAFGVLRWFDFKSQQILLNKINNVIIEGSSFNNFVKDKRGWHLWWRNMQSINN